jgi:predicted kinase
VRGKVEGFTLLQPEIDAETKVKTLDNCKRYFALACDYASRSRPPLLLITCGLVGTGKSLLAHGIADAHDMDVISSDVVRKELAGIAPHDRRHESYQRGIYSRRFTQQTYKAMLDRARELLKEGRSVILDATFSQKRQREMAHRLADEAGALFFCLEATADEKVVRQRLEQRSQDASAVSDAGWEVYEAQRATFEPITELDGWNHVVIDTGQSAERSREDALRSLEERLSPASVE